MMMMIVCNAFLFFCFVSLSLYYLYPPQVEFPSAVKWMVIEFDPQCATGQPEDSLQLYIPAYNCQSRSNQGQACKIITTTTTTSDLDPNLTFWPVLKRLYGTIEWPKSAVLLPGKLYWNSLTLSWL